MRHTNLDCGKPSSLHNDLNVIQSIFIGKLLFFKNGQHRERQQKLPYANYIHLPTPLIKRRSPLQSSHYLFVASRCGTAGRRSCFVEAFALKSNTLYIQRTTCFSKSNPSGDLLLRTDGMNNASADPRSQFCDYQQCA